MKNGIAYDAMMFAREKHKTQRRKYTGNPYTDHLAEVAGTVATITSFHSQEILPAAIIATAWLHDVAEDQAVTLAEIQEQFGSSVAIGVELLSDLEEGNRAERKAKTCERLSKAAGWIQSVKVADLISNTSSIVENDPKFARVYLREKLELLEVLTGAHPGLLTFAHDQIMYAHKGF